MRGDFVLVTHPDKAPACDFITRSTVGPFVDTGVDITLRSQPGMPVATERVYLAAATIKALAQVAQVSETASISRAHEDALIAQGELEGFQEGIGDGLVDLARTLRRWFDAIDDGSYVRSGN